MGIPLRVLPALVDESVFLGESPEHYVARIAAEKGEAVLAQVRSGESRSAILVADTVVVLDGDILGKPRDEAHAFDLVSRLAGRMHRVLTAYRLVTPLRVDSPLVARIVESRVWLRAADPEELRRYAATGEGLDKAGAYAVQGVGAFLVERLEGSYSNVVGLPACEVVLDLKRVGLLGAFP